jgi:hypothetical protein
MTARGLLIKSFCGVQGQFFQKAPLAAGGIGKNTNGQLYSSLSSPITAHS